MSEPRIEVPEHLVKTEYSRSEVSSLCEPADYKIAFTDGANYVLERAQSAIDIQTMLFIEQLKAVATNARNLHGTWEFEEEINKLIESLKKSK